MATLYKGQDFEFDAKLARKDRPHRINDAAIVRAAIFDTKGVMQTAWTTYANNNGVDSDWKIGVVAESIPSSETASISSSSGELRINIQGAHEDRDGVIGNSYDLTWSFGISIK